MEKAEYTQREWRRKSICRVYGEGRVYAERMEKAKYMEKVYAERWRRKSRQSDGRENDGGG
jgi:hypothetical protein